MKVRNNAKINLNLKITGFKDGYHMLDSIFVPISIYDDIEIIESNFDEITGMNINKEDNIIFKAINLIRSRYNINKHFKVIINKKIPIQAGLGGGSSNAAAILKALNEMLELKINEKTMISLALELGSDVPFFIYNKPARVKGRGEQITIIKDFNKIYGVLVFDDLFFSTKEVYSTYDRIEKKDDLNNDLENAARIMPGGKRIIEIESVLKENGAYQASLTGSGGAIFGLFETKEAAISVQNKLKDSFVFIHYFESVE